MNLPFFDDSLEDNSKLETTFVVPPDISNTPVLLLKLSLPFIRLLLVPDESSAGFRDLPLETLFCPRCRKDLASPAHMFCKRCGRVVTSNHQNHRCSASDYYFTSFRPLQFYRGVTRALVLQMKRDHINRTPHKKVDHLHNSLLLSMIASQILPSLPLPLLSNLVQERNAILSLL